MTRGWHPSDGNPDDRPPTPPPAPYDWQTEEDLDAWEEELAAYYGPGLAISAKLLDMWSPRGLPKWVHD